MFPSLRVKTVVSLVVVSALIGAFAALAATAIGSLTSSALSPLGGALLGMAFGVTGGNLTAHGRSGTRAFSTALVRALVAGGTSALMIALIQG
jgi:hypothetical protein